MKNNLLKSLLAERMKKEKLSLREAARESNVSHTTIARILEGHSVDIDTFLVICEWLGVSPSEVLDAQVPGELELSAKLASVIRTYPELAPVLQEAVEKVERQEASPELIKDLFAYITYRINLS
jgi:transcriptional regulator with XRE-family HTH domain